MYLISNYFKPLDLLNIKEQFLILLKKDLEVMIIKNKNQLIILNTYNNFLYLFKILFNLWCINCILWIHLHVHVSTYLIIHIILKIYKHEHAHFQVNKFI